MISSKLATGLLLILLSLGGHHDAVQAQTQTSSVTDGQIQACRAAMIAVDVDLDGRVNRAEYVNLVSAISGPPFFSADCDDFAGEISNFLGTATFSTLFQDLACKCLERAPPLPFGVIFSPATTIYDPNCCTGNNQHLKVPSASASGANALAAPANSYTMQVCTSILEAIDQECSTPAPSVSSAPSHQPVTAAPTVSRSPSVSPSVWPSAAPSVTVALQIVESTPTLQGGAPAPPLDVSLPQGGGDKIEEDLPLDVSLPQQEGGNKEEDVITSTTDEDNMDDENNNDDDDDNFRTFLIASIAAAGGLVLIVILIFSICMRRQRQQKVSAGLLLDPSSSAAAKAPNGKSRSGKSRSGKSRSGKSRSEKSITIAAGDTEVVLDHTLTMGDHHDDEVLDHSHTELMEGDSDEYDEDNNNDDEVQLAHAAVIIREDHNKVLDTPSPTGVTQQWDEYANDNGHVDYGFEQEHVFDNNDEDDIYLDDKDDVETMQDEEQGIVGSSNHQDDRVYSLPATSSVSSYTIFSDDEDNYGVIGNIESYVGDDEIERSESSDNSDDHDFDNNKIRNKTVGPLTWKQGDDDDNDGDTPTDSNSDGDTITSLVSVGDMGDDKDSIAESIEHSYTSVDSKGSRLSSREIAINTIIEQSKNGAEWFEFNLPSDDEHDDDDSDDDDDDGSYTADNLGLDPADAAALRAIASGRGHHRL